jgi:hypothetical protein
MDENEQLTVGDCVTAARNLLRGYGSLNLRNEEVRAEMATTVELANTWLRMGELIARAPSTEHRAPSTEHRAPSEP